MSKPPITEAPKPEAPKPEAQELPAPPHVGKITPTREEVLKEIPETVEGEALTDKEMFDKYTKPALEKLGLTIPAVPHEFSKLPEEEKIKILSNPRAAVNAAPLVGKVTGRDRGSLEVATTMSLPKVYAKEKGQAIVTQRSRSTEKATPRAKSPRGPPQARV